MDQIKIGKFIAALRKEKNMTQSELAEKLGVSNRAVSKWETGKSMPDSGIMLELCALLSINVNELLSGERISADEYNAKAEENMIALSKRNSNRSNSGYGIVSILTIIFVVLKLTNNIDWSWVWVLSPIWITLIIGAGLFAIVLIVGKIKKGKW
ncbi:MAG: helix-turn-helix domain-containing protein [Erysipelotrichaceae bacterium]|jgi:transcriptional regulator with XRE-family HTH domain|nr:helix-turn-helix domain-containing protein [Erysipelotrichaceae bacterium]